MYHPLLMNTANLKDSDIEAKVADLSKKFNIASRMGNPELCSQIALIIEELKVEMSERHTKKINQTINNKNLTQLVKID